MCLRVGDLRWEGTLRLGGRCGRLGLRGLIAVRIRPPNGSSDIFEDVGTRLHGASSVPSIRCSLSVSSGEAIGAILSPPAVMGSNPRSSRRRHPYRCIAVGPFTGLREVSTTSKCNASRPGRKACCGCAVWRAQPSIQSHASRRAAGGKEVWGASG